jgi:hypothetical protein
MSILIFPLIADNSLSPTIISGVCKTIEKYLMIYRLDKLTKIGGFAPSGKVVRMVAGATEIMIANYLSSKFGNKKIVKALVRANKNNYDKSKILLSEADNKHVLTLDKFSEIFEDEILQKGFKDLAHFKKEVLCGDVEQDLIDSITGKSGKSGKEYERITINELTKDDNDNKKKYVRPPEIKSPTLNVSTSLEPTWTTISGEHGTHVIGIKVAAYPITNAKIFVHQMLKDKDMKGVKKVIKATSRNFQRSLFYNVISRISPLLRFFGITMSSLKGDPVYDILKGKSVFNETPFLLLNYNEIKDDSFFADAGGIDQLFAMGWTSIVAADDVGKRAIFCMREFNGLCNVIPYSFIYSGLGRDAMNVYKDLEELRKSTAPYFSSKQSSKKFFSESYIKELVEKYGSLNFPCLKGECD